MYFLTICSTMILPKLPLGINELSSLCQKVKLVVMASGPLVVFAG